MIAAKQYENPSFAGYYNVGPDDKDCVKSGELVNLFIDSWGKGLKRVDIPDGGPHEAGFLKLDCTKLKTTFGWSPKWDIKTAVQKVVDWTKQYKNGEDVRACMERQIRDYLNE